MDALEALASLALDHDGVRLVAPCVHVTLYFWQEPEAILRDAADRAMEALDPHLTRYLAGAMGRFAARGARSEKVFAAVLERSKPTRMGYISFRGEGEGCSAAALRISAPGIVPLPATEEARAALLEKNRATYEQHGRIFYSPGVTSIVASFPLDHPLARPDALLEWVHALRAVREGAFVSGHAGYGLNAYEEVGSRALGALMRPVVRGALARHPGLNYEALGGGIGRDLLLYWPGHVRFLPRFKRANWLTLVPELSIAEQLRGRAHLIEALADGPEVVAHAAGGGVVVRAGPAPALGDDGIPPPAYRFVARVLAPARLDRIGAVSGLFDAEEATAWLGALEGS